MKITVARRLAIAFGAMLLAFAMCGIMVRRHLMSIETELHRLARQDAPVAGLLHSLEVATLDTGDGVMNYVATGDPSLRDKFAADVRHFDDDYARLSGMTVASDDKSRREGLKSEFKRFRELGGALIEQRDRRTALAVALPREFATLDQLLTQRLLTQFDEDEPRGAEKVQVTELIEAGLGHMVGAYQSYRQSLSVADTQNLRLSEDECRKAFADLLLMPLSDFESEAAVAWMSQFNSTTGKLRDLLAADANLIVQSHLFTKQRDVLRKQLESEVQLALQSQATLAEKEARTRLRTAHQAIWAMVLVGLMIGFLAALWVGQAIAIPIGLLAEGANRIGRGELQHRIPVKSQDEFGELASAFNRMAENRQIVEANTNAISARLKAILDASTQASIIATDAAGVITLFNTGAERLLGYSAEEMIGKSPAMIHLPEEVEEHGRRLSQEFGTTIEGFEVFVAHARRGGHEEREWTYVRQDGSHVTVNLVVTAQRDSDGGIIGFLGVAKNITEQKQFESELLEAKVAAEAADRAKSAFLANMSHEIRTPMNAVMGMTDLVLDTPLTAEQREYLEIVKDSADSLLRLINDILDFSKIEAGRLELEQTNFGLRELLGSTLRTLSFRASDKGVELALRVPPAVPDSLVGDPHRLRQIVTNLVSNGIKFTKQGEVAVEVDFVKTAWDRVELRVSVRDTGVGIPAEKLDSIFAAFTQVDTSTTREFGGTGLGLAIASRLVGLMEGRIQVTSELGAGSTFHFSARLGLGKDAALPPSLPSGMRVLVVDDNETSRQIVGEMLVAGGVQPAFASDAAAGLELLEISDLETAPFELVLVDAQLPDIDGFQFCEQIAASGLASKPRVIVMSPGVAGDAIGRCERAGAAGHILKPVRQAELFKLIREGVDESGIVAVPPELATPEVPAAPRALNVLLAEDNLANQKLAVGLLTRWGHTVTIAQNGREAVELCAQGEFDAVLMDVQMPEMDGYQATAAIRHTERESGRHLPIIAMTANAMQGDREECLQAGMDAYIAKPIRAQELSSLLTKVGQNTPLPPVELSETAHTNGVPLAANLDWNQALRTTAGDRVLLSEVLAALLEETPQLLDRIRQAARGGDFKTLQRESHSLKGSLRMFGEGPASSAAFQIESQAQKQIAPENTLIDELDVFSEQVLSEVREYLAKQPSG